MNAASVPQPPAAPLPEKLALLVHEARWLLVGLAGMYLALVLWGFDRADPGWSHAAAADHIANPGGRVGAWLSDLLLYLFGFSAWWWVVLPFFLVAWGYHRLSHLFGGGRRPLLIALTGFLLLLLASCGLEAMRFWSSKVALPMEPGGMLGFEVGRLVALFLGYTGGTMVLLVLAMIGFSLFTGLSWITAAETTGILIEGAVVGARSLWEGWQDRRYAARWPNSARRWWNPSGARSRKARSASNLSKSWCRWRPRPWRGPRRSGRRRCSSTRRAAPCRRCTCWPSRRTILPTCRPPRPSNSPRA
jgi:DNA segregation ATPase FtsK/SpoIIIE-like protein